MTIGNQLMLNANLL